jgi:hypothetical protein
MSRKELEQLESELKGCFTALERTQEDIHQKLIKCANGKKLKGDEIVGWLGEIYGKLLLGGTLVLDNLEHDFVADDGRRISVKARKGRAKGWNQTSAISKIEGADCPTHLMFVHLNDDYFVDRIWLYPWKDLRKSGRFGKHIVRGSPRSFIFRVNVRSDEKYLFYPEATL